MSGDEGEEQELHVDLDLDDDAQPQVEQLQPGLNANKLECLSVPSLFRLVLYGALLEQTFCLRFYDQEKKGFIFRHSYSVKVS